MRSLGGNVGMLLCRAALGLAVVPGLVHAQAAYECVIQPRQILEIRSPVEGLIQRVHVDRGQSVRRGQLLATIDDSVERVAAEAARHRAGMAGAVNAAESRVTVTSRKLERVQELIANKFLSAQALDDAQNEKRLAEAELLEARDLRRAAEIELGRQSAIIQLKSIRSPINGVVIERLLNTGELAEAGVGRRPILRLAEIDVLHVEALLPAEAWKQVKVGLSGDVEPAVGGGTHRARVAVVDRILDAGSGTFGVRLELPNPGHVIPAGTRCRLQLDGVDVPVRRSGTPPARPAR
jgi:RND family efflux transporter MFP subunit